LRLLLLLHFFTAIFLNKERLYKGEVLRTSPFFINTPLNPLLIEGTFFSRRKSNLLFFRKIDVIIERKEVWEEKGKNMNKLCLNKKVLMVFLFVIAFSMLAITTTVQANQCATFDYESYILHVPCFNFADTSFWMDLTLIPSESIILELTNYGDNGTPGSAQECASFDFYTYTLQIPCLNLEGTNYCLDLALLLDTESILLELVGYDFTGVNILGGIWFGNYSTNIIPSSDTMFTLTQSCTFFSGSYQTTSDSYNILEENEGVVNGIFIGRVSGNTVTFSMYQITPQCRGTFSGYGTLSDNMMYFNLEGSDCLGSHSSGQGSVRLFWKK
jgi:hypothetical protein